MTNVRPFNSHDQMSLSVKAKAALFEEICSKEFNASQKASCLPSLMQGATNDRAFPPHTSSRPKGNGKQVDALVRQLEESLGGGNLTGGMMRTFSEGSARAGGGQPQRHENAPLLFHRSTSAPGAPERQLAERQPVSPMRNSETSGYQRKTVAELRAIIAPILRENSGIPYQKSPRSTHVQIEIQPQSSGDMAAQESDTASIASSYATAPEDTQTLDPSSAYSDISKYGKDGDHLLGPINGAIYAVVKKDKSGDKAALREPSDLSENHSDRMPFVPTSSQELDEFIYEDESIYFDVEPNTSTSNFYSESASLDIHPSLAPTPLFERHNISPASMRSELAYEAAELSGVDRGEAELRTDGKTEPEHTARMNANGETPSPASDYASIRSRFDDLAQAIALLSGKLDLPLQRRMQIDDQLQALKEFCHWKDVGPWRWFTRIRTWLPGGERYTQKRNADARTALTILEKLERELEVAGRQVGRTGISLAV